MATIEDVLHYSNEEYTYVVLARDVNGTAPEFWTLEKSEDEAKSRIERELEAYCGIDESPYEFFYHPIERTTQTLRGKQIPLVKIVYDVR